MNRHNFIDDYTKPSNLAYLGKVWCSWNASQARECKTREMCIHTMREAAKKYGVEHMGANCFDSWDLEENVDFSHEPIFQDNGIEIGSMRITGRAYYKS